MSPLELVGDSDRIVKELRASRPVASAALRERVTALGPEPAPRRSFHWPSRRLVLSLAAAALVASFVAAGLTRGSNHAARVESSGAKCDQSGRSCALGSFHSRASAQGSPCPGRRAGSAPALPGDPAPAGQGRRGALDRDQARDDARPFARRLRRRGAVLDPRRQARRREGRAARPGRQRPGRADDPDRARHDPAAADRNPRRHAPRRPRVAPDREAREAARDREPAGGAGDPRAPAHAAGQAPAAPPQREPCADRADPDDTRSSRLRPRADSTGRSTTPAACSCASCSSCSTRWSSLARCSSSAAPASPRRVRRGSARTDDF